MGGYNLVSTIGSFILGIGVLITVINILHSIRHGKRAGNDPWQGNTLEWFTQSPPPANNFDVIPRVRSVEPMKDIRREVAAAARAPRPCRSRPRHAACSLEPPVTSAPSTGYRRLALATARCHLPADHRRRHRARVGLRPGLRPGRLGLPRLAVLQRRRGARPRPELDHRVLAPGAGRRRRDPDRGARRAGVAPLPGAPRAGVGHLRRCVLLVFAQAALGGATVEENLEEALVAAHLGLAMLLLGGLLWVWRATRPDVTGAAPADGGPRLPRARRGHLGRRALHDRRRRLHGRHAEVRAPGLPARRRRAPRLRQGVPQLQRRLHAVRPGAPRGHPPDPPRVHVPDHAPCAHARGARRCAAARAPAWCAGRARWLPCSSCRCSWAR